MTSHFDYWPPEVPPLVDPRHEQKLREWLLGVLPASVRSHRVVHRHIGVLLHLAEAELLGSVEGLRNGYATARTQLSQEHAPETIAAALVAIAETGQSLAAELAFVQRIRETRDD